MINIVKNGREKTFRERCHECATEYDYNIDDVIEIEDKTASLPFMRRRKFVPCPVCGGKAKFQIFGHSNDSLSSMAYKYQIECDKCGATNNEVGLTALLFEKDGSINTIQDDRWKLANAWNRRAKDAE